jgi:hypothetical protein
MPITQVKGGTVENDDIHEIRIRRVGDKVRYEVKYQKPEGLGVLRLEPTSAEKTKIAALLPYLKTKITEAEGL